MTDVRTRFAPSPTGYLHVGGARTALFNYLFAKANGGKFILRIEDTDKERSTTEATEQVIESMKWLGLEWDEGPGVDEVKTSYYQSKRLNIYQQYLDQLLEEGKCYHCFCTTEELAEKKKRQEALGKPSIYDGTCRHLTKDTTEKKIAEKIPFTYRFKVPPQEIVFNDLVRGKVKFDSKLIGDFIIRKADGFPTYNFAVVVDDALMKITHVLRGDDHISNTPRQLFIYKALNFPFPQFCHISMILGADREKLSKRHGATSVLEYKKKGYLVEPFLNFLALLGWSPEDGTEIISKKTLEKVFIGTKFSKSPAIFDASKLDFLNGHYIRNLEFNNIVALLLPEIQKGPYKDHPIVKNGGENLHEIIKATKDYCKKISDINDYLGIFFEDDFSIPAHLRHYLTTDTSKALMSLAIKYFSQVSEQNITTEEFKGFMKEAKTKLNVGGKLFFKPMRVAVSGVEDGIELDVLFKVLPRRSVIKRLERAEA